MLQPGQHIQDRFIVEELVGRGGLAEVYRVRHLELGSVHALKLLLFRKKTLAARLLLEGRIQAQLRHPNIVAVTDVIRHEGQHGLLMEYVDNITLEEFIDTRGPVPTDEALDVIAAVLAGVHAAHTAGVLHRDLKPANVLLAKVGGGLVPKVSDFGIAKVLDDLDGSTRENVAMGTPGYMAPEQVLDARSVDARTDIFALAGMVYELISGRHAFENEQGIITLKSTIEATVVPLAERVEAVPASVADAVNKGLSRDREDRQPDVATFASELLAERPELLALVLGVGQAAPLTLDPSRPSRYTESGTRTDEGVPTSGGGPTLMPAPGSVKPARPPLPARDGGTVAADPTPPPPQESNERPVSPIFWTGALLVAGLLLLAGTLGVVFAGPALGLSGTASNVPLVDSDEQARSGIRGSVRIREGGVDDGLAEADTDASTPSSSGSSDASDSGTNGTAQTSQPTASGGGAAVGAQDGDDATADPDSSSGEAAGGTDGDDPEDGSVSGVADTDVDVDTEVATTLAAQGDSSAEGTAEPDEGEGSGTPVETPTETTPDPEPARTMVMPIESFLASSWDGKVYRQPLTLRILDERGGDVVGEGRIVIGAQQRILRLTGRYDPYTGAIYLKETNGSLVMQGTVSGRMIAGTYQREGKGSPQALELMRR